MEDMEYMYLTTSKSIYNSLKAKVSGAIRTEFNTTARILIVDISFKEFKFRQVITDFDKYVFEGGIDNLVTIIVGTYRKQLLHAFFKNEKENSHYAYV